MWVKIITIFLCKTKIAYTRCCSHTLPEEQVITREGVILLGAIMCSFEVDLVKVSCSTLKILIDEVLLFSNCEGASSFLPHGRLKNFRLFLLGDRERLKAVAFSRVCI